MLHATQHVLQFLKLFFFIHTLALFIYSFFGTAQGNQKYYNHKNHAYAKGLRKTNHDKTNEQRNLRNKYGKRFIINVTNP